MLFVQVAWCSCSSGVISGGVVLVRVVCFGRCRDLRIFALLYVQAPQKSLTFIMMVNNVRYLRSHCRSRFTPSMGYATHSVVFIPHGSCSLDRCTPRQTYHPFISPNTPSRSSFTQQQCVFADSNYYVDSAPRPSSCESYTAPGT